MDAAGLLSLSDDTLLAVLAYLPTRELFSVRTVCRRLRELCLNRQLWSHASVKDKGLMHAALALAPCLRHLHVSNVPLDAVASFVRSTTCVVQQLRIAVANQNDADMATHIIQKLSAVGELKSLGLVILRSFALEYTLTPLLQAVYNIHGLQQLIIKNFSKKVLPAALCGLEGGPSVSKLIYWTRSVEPFLESILQTHADSLQEIIFHKLDGVPVSSLARIPKLRSLTCSSHEDLPQLLHLNLEVLNLYSFDFKLGPGTLELIRQAARLRSVSFKLPLHNPDAPLIALVASPSARIIAKLNLRGVFNLNRVAMVAAALPEFSALKTLSVDAVPSHDFLRAVGPASAPRLTKLSVHPPPPPMCAHAWLHGPAVQDLLVRNPALHLRLEAASVSPSISESCECQWCLWGCHRPLKGLGKLNYSFSSHNRRAGCPRKCFQVAVPICASCDRLIR